MATCSPCISYSWLIVQGEMFVNWRIMLEIQPFFLHANNSIVDHSKPSARQGRSRRRLEEFLKNESRQSER